MDAFVIKTSLVREEVPEKWRAAMQTKGNEDTHICHEVLILPTVAWILFGKRPGEYFIIFDLSKTNWKYGR